MSLHTQLRGIIDVMHHDGEHIREAEDIHPDNRPALISAWRMEASLADCYDAFMNPADNDAERVLQQLVGETAWAARVTVTAGFPELQRLMQAYWYRQITKDINDAITKILEDMADERRWVMDRDEESKTDWMREAI